MLLNRKAVRALVKRLDSTLSVKPGYYEELNREVDKLIRKHVWVMGSRKRMPREIVESARSSSPPPVGWQGRNHDIKK